MPKTPAPEDLFIARWRDRLGLAIALNDDQALIEFARLMYSVEEHIDVTWRDESRKPEIEF
jgi:hypothetical protein